MNSNQSPIRRIVHTDDEESQYYHIPGNEPILLLNDAFRKLANSCDLTQLKIDTPSKNAPSGMPTFASCTIAGSESYVGEGVNLHRALRDMLDKVNQDFPLGEEYSDLFPPAA